MKKLLVIIPFFIGWTSTDKYSIEPLVKLQPKPIKTIEVEFNEPNIIELKIVRNLEPLINAMIQVESRDNDSAVGDGGRAVGCLQIHPIMVREANRILKLQKSSISYNLLDRWDREKSIEIFYIVNNYHHENATYEEIARAWNGGPNWAEKSLTKRYWKRVQKQLKKQKKNERSNTEFTEV